MNAVHDQASAGGEASDSSNGDAARLARVLGWLPDAARRDDHFAPTARRVVAECDPHSTQQEHAVARILCAMWRMKPLMAAGNDELDERALAETEKSLARAELSWCRLRRLEIAEQRAKERGTLRHEQAQPDARPRPASVITPEPVNPMMSPDPVPSHDAPPRASPAGDFQALRDIAGAQPNTTINLGAVAHGGPAELVATSHTPDCRQQFPDPSGSEQSTVRRTKPRAPSQSKHSARLRRRHAARGALMLAGT